MFELVLILLMQPCAKQHDIFMYTSMFLLCIIFLVRAAIQSPWSSTFSHEQKIQKVVMKNLNLFRHPRHSRACIFLWSNNI